MDIIRELQLILKKIIYDDDLDRKMVWSYLCGRNDSSEENFKGVKVVFGVQGSAQQAYAQSDWTFETKTNSAKAASSVLKEARWDAAEKIKKQQRSRCHELRSKKKYK